LQHSLLTRPHGVQPCYTWLDVPYYWAGMKTYDLVANFSNLAASRFLTAAESRRRFPTLAGARADGHTLKGTVRAHCLLSWRCVHVLQLRRLRRTRALPTRGQAFRRAD
jgi:hypothetical protein